MIEQLVNLITAGIQAMGYLGIFVLMMLESMVAPVPSEAVMPFAGYLVSQGAFSFRIVILASTLGSIAGSLISYTIGYYGGKPFIEKAGKYFFLNKHHLAWTERYFARKGSMTILIARFVPVVRHLISIPAGAAKMNLKKFVLFTAIGAGIWNTFLLFIGVQLSQNWVLITTYARFLDIAVIVVIVAYLLFHFKEPIQKRVQRKKS